MNVVKQETRNEIATVEPSTDDVLDLKEAASFLKVCTKTLHKLACEGRVPHRRIGAQYRFSRSRLSDFVAGK